MRTDAGHRRNHGFTLIELMVVIVIISVLIGILIPVVKKVRLAAYSADTAQVISNLSNAINQYQVVFHAYPGPFSNDQLEAGLVISEIYNSTTQQFTAPSAAQAAGVVTGAENLYLGLNGGLRIDSKGNWAYAPGEIGLGPLNLNPADPRRYTSFMNAGTGSSSIVSAGKFSIEGQLSPCNDTIIPEYVDKFPTPMPILYLRARVGANGIISTLSTNAFYQYDIRDIYVYTNGLATNLAPPRNRQGLRDVGTLTYPPQVVVPGSPTVPYPNVPQTGATSGQNAGNYFMNPSITPTDISSSAGINATGRPRSVDQFILISPGPDGIYGTADDIVSFGSVLP